jgi:hypothetical protein
MVGAINIAQKTKEFGESFVEGFGIFVKAIGDKTKSKLADAQSSGKQQDLIELQDETPDA